MVCVVIWANWLRYMWLKGRGLNLFCSVYLSVFLFWVIARSSKKYSLFPVKCKFRILKITIPLINFALYKVVLPFCFLFINCNLYPAIYNQSNGSPNKFLTPPFNFKTTFLHISCDLAGRNFHSWAGWKVIGILTELV